MKKQITIFGITFLLLVVGFSGCEEKKNDNVFSILGDTEKVNLSSYNIVTYNKNNEKIGNGFFHNSNAYLYKITGTVKNIVGGVLLRVYTGIIFLDINNNYLNSKIYLVPNVKYNSLANFSISYGSIEKDFEKIDKIKFYLYVVME